MDILIHDFKFHFKFHFSFPDFVKSKDRHLPALLQKLEVRSSVFANSFIFHHLKPKTWYSHRHHHSSLLQSIDITLPIAWWQPQSESPSFSFHRFSSAFRSRPPFSPLGSFPIHIFVSIPLSSSPMLPLGKIHVSLSFHFKALHKLSINFRCNAVPKIVNKTNWILASKKHGEKVKRDYRFEDVFNWEIAINSFNRLV